MQVHDGGGQSARQAPSKSRIAFPLPSEKGFATKRVLLVGSGALLSRAVNEAGSGPRPVYVAGVVESGPNASGAMRHAGAPVLGGLEDIESVVVEQCIDEIRAVLPERRLAEKLPDLEAAAKELGVPLASYFPSRALSVRGEAEEQGKLVIHSRQHPSNRGWRRMLKRSIDLLVSGSALVLLAPLFAIIGILIKLTSPGPVMFRQQRIGTWRRQFRMLKFRTMLENAEELRARVQNNARGISFKVFDDPRVTPIGSLLRRASLDELPQLVNVFLGDMSLVGPRPIPVWVAEQMQGSAYLRRFSVKQGLTGLWQVEGRQQDFDYMSMQDLRYVDNWSLVLDLKILLQTLPAVIRGSGAH